MGCRTHPPHCGRPGPRHLALFTDNLGRLQIIDHFFSADRRVVVVFFQWPVEGGRETSFFIAVCLKLEEQEDLFVATICHELYPHNRKLLEFGFFPEKNC
jgi:hypothetical protein